MFIESIIIIGNIIVGNIALVLERLDYQLRQTQNFKMSLSKILECIFETSHDHYCVDINIAEVVSLFASSWTKVLLFCFQ